MKISILKYNNTHTGKESVSIIDSYGDDFESLQQLRDTLTCYECHILSEAFGNFSFFTIYVGSENQLHEYLQEEKSHEVEQMLIRIDKTNLTFNEARLFLQNI